MSMQQYILILLARRKAIFSMIAMAIIFAGARCLLQSKIYTAQSDLVIEARVADPVTGANIPSQLVPGYLETQVQIIGSNAVALRVVDQLNLTSDPYYLERARARDDDEPLQEWVAGRLLKALKVRSSKEQSIIELYFNDVDRERSARIANAFAREYIEVSRSLSLASMNQNQAFFSSQIQRLRSDLEKAQRALSTFQQDHGVLTVDERNDVGLKQMEQTSGQLAEAHARAAVAASRLKQAQDYLKHGSSLENVPEVLESVTIQQLKANLAEQERNREAIISRYAPLHPRYIEMMKTISELRHGIQEESRRILSSAFERVRVAQQSERELERKIQQQKVDLLGQKKLRDEAEVLNRDVNNAQRAYDNALQRSGHLRLEGQTNQAHVAVLNPATPPAKASSPRLLRSLFIALSAGTISGIFAALFLERRDRRIRGTVDIVTRYSIPVLAEIGLGTERRLLQRRLLGYFRRMQNSPQ